jgi:hypothetical protein
LVSGWIWDENLRPFLEVIRFELGADDEIERSVATVMMVMQTYTCTRS